MDCKEVIERSYTLVKTLLMPLKDKGYYFHNWEHTKEVFENAQFYATKLRLSYSDTCKLLLAALFHDVGFLVVYNGHEEVSAQIAKEFLKGQVPSDWIKQIMNMIRATKIGVEPQNLLEAALKDSDVDNIRREDFLQKADLLKKELETLFNMKFTPQEWLKRLEDVLEIGKCYTWVCEDLKKEGLKNNASLIKLLKKANKN